MMRAIGIVLIAAGAIAFMASQDDGVATAPVVVEAESKIEPVPLADRAEAPGSFLQQRVARVDAGIPCPDGTFLPPLNGVRPGDPIPAMRREAYMAPLGDVVGMWTDEDGLAWWVFEDGSAVSTRWVTIDVADGSTVTTVRLDQMDSMGDGFAVAGGR